MYRMDKWMNTEICNGISYYSMSFLQQHKPSWFIIISQSLTLYVSFLCLAWFSIGVTLPETFLDRREKSLLYFYWGTIDNTTITFLSLFLWWRQPDVCMCLELELQLSLENWGCGGRSQNIIKANTMSLFICSS